MLQKIMAAMGVCALTLGGCGGGEGDPDVTSDEAALTAANGLAANGLAANGLAANGLAANGLAANGLAANGLAANGLAANGLAANGLAANGLAANGLAANGLKDPKAQAFMTYLVSCALPAGHSVTYTVAGATYKFAGELGLTPEWEGKACDLSCQRWISACILSRVNHLGVHREISMRGDNKALAVVPNEVEQYSQPEATYYGNVFQQNAELYACLPPGATSITRVCGDSLSDCPMSVVGSCSKVCQKQGAFQTYVDCSSVPLVQGKLGADLRRTLDKPYKETVSVFLAP